MRIVVIGDPEQWAQSGLARRKSLGFLPAAFDPRIVHRPGLSTAESGRDSLLYLERAVDLIKKGGANALVTAPVSKESISRFIPGFKGHTTYLANAFGCRNVEMLFAAQNMKLVLLTRHIPLHEVPAAVTLPRVLGVIASSYRFCVDRFGIVKPKIAVLGLNPHAGEGGHIGREDVEVILPAIRKAVARGMDVHGPFPADTFFEPRICRGFDLVIAMYHDQGLTALKALYFNELVNVSIGLPFIRTSPVHGTAFGIAGRGAADAGSMSASLRLACRL
jgi:4-hydroxythreonine-4-phosphate dehydrogenase